MDSDQDPFIERLVDEVREWETEGIIDGETVDRILMRYRKGFVVPPQEPDSQSPLGTGLLSVFYLGGLLIVLGSTCLISAIWSELPAHVPGLILMAVVAALSMTGIRLHTRTPYKISGEIILGLAGVILPTALWDGIFTSHDLFNTDNFNDVAGIWGLVFTMSTVAYIIAGVRFPARIFATLIVIGTLNAILGFMVQFDITDSALPLALASIGFCGLGQLTTRWKRFHPLTETFWGMGAGMCLLFLWWEALLHDFDGGFANMLTWVLVCSAIGFTALGAWAKRRTVIITGMAGATFGLLTFVAPYIGKGGPLMFAIMLALGIGVFAMGLFVMGRREFLKDLWERTRPPAP